MSQQLRLQALNQRLIGDQYIGRPTVVYNPAFHTRRNPPTVRQYPRPVFQYVPDPETDSIETESVGSDENAQRQIFLEYRITGITWYTPRFTNSCNLDSFLSAWVRKIRQTHGKFLKWMETCDLAGVALLKIADHALCAKEHVDSEFVKGMWLSSILQNTGEVRQMLNPQMDLTGNNMYSVFQHLYQHCAFEIQSSCPCGKFYNQDFIFFVNSLEQVKNLGHPNNLQNAEMPKCLKCSQNRLLLQINPIKGMMMAVFYYRGSVAQNNLSPMLDDIPQIICLSNFTFKLEYVSYSQDTPIPNLYHEVSLQYIRCKWYLFDSARSPKFRWWGGKQYYKHNCNAKLMTLVYFRVN